MKTLKKSDEWMEINMESIGLVDMIEDTDSHTQLFWFYSENGLIEQEHKQIINLN